MSKEILMFGHIEIKKKYRHKSTIFKRCRY